MTVQVGRRVEFASTSDSRVIFRAELLRVLCNGYYALVRDRTGRNPRLVRAKRLHPVGWHSGNGSDAA